MVYKPPQQQLEETKARLAAAQRYLEGDEGREHAMTSLDQLGSCAGAGLNGVYRVGGNISGALRKSLSEERYATLGIAAAIGFAIGAIWRL